MHLGLLSAGRIFYCLLTWLHLIAGFLSDVSEETFLVRQKRSTFYNVTKLEELPSRNECGRATRKSACRLLAAHNIGYVWLWPVVLGAPTLTLTSLQTASTTASALNNVVDLCSGKKALAPYGYTRHCICSTVLDTIYTYAADQIYFSLPVYSLTVIDGTYCRRGRLDTSLLVDAIGKPLPDDDVLLGLPGFHTVDFTCGFSNSGNFAGAVDICSQVAQFCAHAITSHQFIRGALNNYTVADMGSIGIIEMLPFTEHSCGLRFPKQYSIRCSVPCGRTI